MFYFISSLNLPHTGIVSQTYHAIEIHLQLMYYVRFLIYHKMARIHHTLYCLYKIVKYLFTHTQAIIQSSIIVLYMCFTERLTN